MSQKYFLDGTKLSIEHSRFSLSKFSHLLCHLFLSFFEFTWHRAEMLSGRFFWSSHGRNLVLLEEPCVVSLASLSAHSLGLKLQWPGTQCICKLITPLDLPSQWLPASMTWRCSPQFIRPSCFLCSCSAAWWMASSKYWPKCESWLFNALMTTWLWAGLADGWDR